MAHLSLRGTNCLLTRSTETGIKHAPDLCSCSIFSQYIFIVCIVEKRKIARRTGKQYFRYQIYDLGKNPPLPPFICPQSHSLAARCPDFYMYTANEETRLYFSGISPIFTHKQARGRMAFMLATIGLPSPSLYPDTMFLLQKKLLLPIQPSFQWRSGRLYFRCCQTRPFSRLGVFCIRVCFAPSQKGVIEYIWKVVYRRRTNRRGGASLLYPLQPAEDKCV